MRAARRIEADADHGGSGSAADADFVKSLAGAVEETLVAQGALLLVTVGEGAGEGTFTLAGAPPVVDKASGGVAKALDGRGGGKGGRYQGKCQKLGGVSDALASPFVLVFATTMRWFGFDNCSYRAHAGA